MKKSYWIVGILIALVTWFWYSKKTKSVLAPEETEEETEDWTPKERGKATSIDDLPLTCQVKFVGWSKWMHTLLGTANKWADNLKARGETRGNSLDTELEIEFVNMYNNNAATAQCNE